MLKRTMLGLLLLGAMAPVRAHAEDVAKVGGDSISREEFEAKARIEEVNAKRKLSRDERAALLHAIVNQRLLVAEAKRQKLDRSADFKAMMGETERKALADKVYEAEVASKAQVTLDDAKQFYAQNPAAFDIAEVSQILVATAPGKEDAAKKKAEELKASLAKAPKTFAAVAKAQSDDTQSKARGGDLGALRRGMLVQEMEQAVFSAKAPAVLGPIKTQYGYHILYLRSLKRLTWEQAGTSLQQDLQRLRALQLQQALLEKLGKQDKVTTYEDKL